jgi:hypothetical protein
MRSITGRAAVLALIGLMATTAAVLLAAQVAAYGQTRGAGKLEGAWIARVTSSPFPPGLYQWTYVLAPASSGRVASIHGSVDVAFPNPIPHDRTTPLLGEIVQTGPDTAAFNTIWYGLNQGVVFIGRNLGHRPIPRTRQGGSPTQFRDSTSRLPMSTATAFLTVRRLAAFSATSQDTRVPSP